METINHTTLSNSTLFISKPNVVSSHNLIEYGNGLYQGEMNKYFKRHGKGLYLWNTGELYFGSWLNDEMSGEGVLYFSFGGHVYGQFKSNKVHGLAKLVLPNRDYLYGNWVNGKLEGMVLRLFCERNKWALCEYYDGELIRRINDGNSGPPASVINDINKGTKQIQNHDLNIFLNNNHKKKGLGYNGYNTPNGNNSPIPNDNSGHYHCCSCYMNEICYTSFENGSWYNGVMSMNYPNGIGILYYNDIKNDRGIFKEGYLDGPGRTLFTNGDIYDGFYRKGKFHGLGVYYKISENKYMYGIYENDICIEEIKIGEGYPHELMSKILNGFIDIIYLSYIDIVIISNNNNNIIEFIKISNNQNGNYGIQSHHGLQGQNTAQGSIQHQNILTDVEIISLGNEDKELFASIVSKELTEVMESVKNKNRIYRSINSEMGIDMNTFQEHINKINEYWSRQSRQYNNNGNVSVDIDTSVGVDAGTGTNIDNGIPYSSRSSGSKFKNIQYVEYDNPMVLYKVFTVQSKNNKLPQQCIRISTNIITSSSKNTPNSSKNTPRINKNNPSISQNTPNINQNTLSISPNTPNINQNTLSINHNTHSNSKNTPYNDKTTSISNNTPRKNLRKESENWLKKQKIKEDDLLIGKYITLEEYEEEKLELLSECNYRSYYEDNNNGGLESKTYLKGSNSTWCRTPQSILPKTATGRPTITNGTKKVEETNNLFNNNEDYEDFSQKSYRDTEPIRPFLKKIEAIEVRKKEGHVSIKSNTTSGSNKSNKTIEQIPESTPIIYSPAQLVIQVNTTSTSSSQKKASNLHSKYPNETSILDGFVKQTAIGMESIKHVTIQPTTPKKTKPFDLVESNDKRPSIKKSSHMKSFQKHENNNNDDDDNDNDDIEFENQDKKKKVQQKARKKAENSPEVLAKKGHLLMTLNDLVKITDDLNRLRKFKKDQYTKNQLSRSGIKEIINTPSNDSFALDSDENVWKYEKKELGLGKNKTRSANGGGSGSSANGGGLNGNSFSNTKSNRRNDDFRMENTSKHNDENVDIVRLESSGINIRSKSTINEYPNHITKSINEKDNKYKEISMIHVNNPKETVTISDNEKNDRLNKRKFEKNDNLKPFGKSETKINDLEKSQIYHKSLNEHLNKGISGLKSSINSTTTITTNNTTPDKKSMIFGNNDNSEIKDHRLKLSISTTSHHHSGGGDHVRLPKGHAGLPEGRVGLSEGRAGLLEGHTRLPEARVRLSEGCAGLPEGHTKLPPEGHTRLPRDNGLTMSFQDLLPFTHDEKLKFELGLTNASISRSNPLNPGQFIYGLHINESPEMMNNTYEVQNKSNQVNNNEFSLATPQYTQYIKMIKSRQNGRFDDYDDEEKKGIDDNIGLTEESKTSSHMIKQKGSPYRNHGISNKHSNNSSKHSHSSSKNSDNSNKHSDNSNKHSDNSRKHSNNSSIHSHNSSKHSNNSNKGQSRDMIIHDINHEKSFEKHSQASNSNGEYSPVSSESENLSGFYQERIKKAIGGAGGSSSIGVNGGIGNGSNSSSSSSSVGGDNGSGDDKHKIKNKSNQMIIDSKSNNIQTTWISQSTIMLEESARDINNHQLNFKISEFGERNKAESYLYSTPSVSSICTEIGKPIRIR